MSMAIDRRIAERLFGMQVAAEPSGNRVHPTRYRLNYPDGRSVSPRGGCFFGWGWCISPESAWDACPRFSESDTALGMLWDRVLDLGTPHGWSVKVEGRKPGQFVATIFHQNGVESCSDFGHTRAQALAIAALAWWELYGAELPAAG